MKKFNVLTLWIAIVFIAVNNMAYSQTTQKTILDDLLNNLDFISNPLTNTGVSRGVEGGEFSGSGWKPTGDADLVVYDLGRYIELGSLEITVTQFEPTSQNQQARHHILAMFRLPWGTHHAVEKLDTFWDLHTGTTYDPGVKFMADAYYTNNDDEVSETVFTGWNKSLSYQIKMIWGSNQVEYFRNSQSQVIIPFHQQPGFRYVYVGRDRTVSGDLNTGFMNNQYKTMRNPDDLTGPIYSNLKVVEIRSTETTAPSITGITTVDLYDNAARISWQTNESSVCYVKYGTSTSYGQQTKMLGTPATSFTTLLTGLTPNQGYHYKIIAEDNAGNVTESNDQTFTTTTNGVYVFTPVADTYIERNREEDDAGAYSHLYGKTRAFGNYHWMNLMSAKGRYCYLKFKVPSTLSNIRPITLRLYSRQGGESGVELYQFNPVSPDWATTVTWADQESVGGDSHADGFQDSDGGVTGPLLGSIPSPMGGNQWYSFSFANPQSLVSTSEGSFKAYHFALQGAGNTPAGTEKLTQDVSFDSGESTNNQPELIIVTAPTSFTEASFSLPGVEEGDAVWGDYDKDINQDNSQDLDILITGLGATGPLSKIYRNDKSGTTISFVGLATSLESLSYSAADWGDFDMDNTLDILLAGQPTSGAPVTKVYRNDYNGNFSEKTTSLIGVKYGDVAWGNYDNNRCLDILLSGWGSGINFATKVYKGNFSSNTYTWAAQTITLPQLRYSSVAWGHNNPSPPDGYLDLLLAGTKSTTPATDIIEMYKNTTDGGFELATNQLPSLSGTVGMTASCVWGNFDTDDDLDIAFAGRLIPQTSVYKRLSGGTYEGPVDDAALIDVQEGTVAWGDYDNDGDLDLLVTGRTSTGVLISKIYRNDPPFTGSTSRQFTDIAAPLIGVYNGSAAWGDYDNDGDLDILLTGNMDASGAATGRITKIYTNLTNATNALPSVPTLPSNPVTYSATDNTYTLKWNKSTDNQTQQPALTYNIMIGTTSGGFNIVSPMSNKYDGKRWIPAPGNAGTRDNYVFSANGLGNGIYYWKVQAIDNVFGASAFSAEGTFTISAKAAGTDSLADNDLKVIPQAFALSQNYPNPFNPTTRLNLELPENGRVKAVVYDLTGQEVARLQDAEMAAGYKHLEWDGKNNFGASAGSGTYLVKVIFEGVSGLRKESTSRILLVK